MPVVSPTHCKMQGTGINFLHFAETFGLWMTLACKGRSENQIHGTEKKRNVVIFAAVLKIPSSVFTSSTVCPAHQLHSMSITAKSVIPAV